MFRYIVRRTVSSSVRKTKGNQLSALTYRICALHALFTAYKRCNRRQCHHHQRSSRLLSNAAAWPVGLVKGSRGHLVMPARSALQHSSRLGACIRSRRIIPSATYQSLHLRSHLWRSMCGGRRLTMAAYSLVAASSATMGVKFYTKTSTSTRKMKTNKRRSQLALRLRFRGVCRTFGVYRSQFGLKDNPMTPPYKWVTTYTTARYTLKVCCSDCSNTQIRTCSIFNPC